MNYNIIRCYLETRVIDRKRYHRLYREERGVQEGRINPIFLLFYEDFWSDNSLARKVQHTGKKHYFLLL